MVTLSICMIVKNEEAVLERCLESIRGLWDELVVVDTGSTDATVAIAQRYTSQVFHYPWQDDFAAARNFSFTQAHMDYCMWIDADDLLLPKDREELLHLKETLDPSVDLVMMPYHTAFDANGSPTFSYERERWLRRDRQFRWQGAVHEAIPPSGKILHVGAAITHHKVGTGNPDRNLRILEGLLRQKGSLEPRQQYYYGRELLAHGQWIRAAQVLQDFLQQGQGWVENNLDACLVLSKCYQQLGQEERSLHALLHALTYTRPRGEVCCALGDHFMNRGQYEDAIFWYGTALHCPRPQTGAFVQEDCYGYRPALLLCVCYDRLGQRERAREYNELAGQFRPQDPSVLYNRNYFAQQAGHQGEDTPEEEVPQDTHNR